MGSNRQTLSSAKLYEEAINLMPGGVNSPVRAFGSVGGEPLFISSAKGSRVTDADGNEYIDYVGSWGPALLGHAPRRVVEAVAAAAGNGLSFGAPTQAEVKMARLICRHIPGAEMVRMVNSGTEAVMSAIRLARGATGRNRVVKFEGCYHGHSDAMLVKAGSGLATLGVSSSLGVPQGVASDTIVTAFNDVSALNNIFSTYTDIAAVIVEPVAANMGVVIPSASFLFALRELCDKSGALLIFDEVITGFRLAAGGAQEYFGVNADIVTLGKIIGGGMPVGAYTASKDLMKYVSPLGGVYQAGTLSGNPVAMAAGLAQLESAAEDKDFYKRLNQTADAFFRRAADILKDVEDVNVSHIGSLGTIFNVRGPVTNYTQAAASNTQAYETFFRFMLSRGIYLAPSQFEAMFLSAAHTQEDLERTLEAIDDWAQQLKE